MNVLKFSRTFFALSIFAFGLLHFTLDNFNTAKPAAESHIAYIFFGFVFHTLIGACAISMVVVVNKRVPAICLAVSLLLWACIRHVPSLILNLDDPAEWNSSAMAIAIAGGALLLSASLPKDGSRGRMPFQPISYITPAVVGRWLYSVPMGVFGTQHLVYGHFIASLVPSWIPGGILWAYATGAALIAAGCLIIVGIKIKWTAGLLGFMFVLWLILVHIPRIMNHPQDTYEWTSFLQTCALAASAFILSQSDTKHDTRRLLIGTEKLNKAPVNLISKIKKENANRIPKPIASNHRRDIKV